MASTALAPFNSKTQRPMFVPYSLPELENTASNTARQTVEQTNAFRARVNPDWNRALKLGAAGLAGDAGGDSVLMPEIQAEAMRAGLGASLGSFGDVGNTLTPGSAGSAKVSTNLFGTANALNQQMRQNRNTALQIGSSVFPDTQVGLSGQDAALISGANTLGWNSFNEAQYRDKLENDRLNWRVKAENQRTAIQQGNANAAADAQSDATTKQTAIAGGAAVAGVAVLAIAL